MNRTRRQGFTLIELLVVIAVISVVMYIGGTFFSQMMTLRRDMHTEAEMTNSAQNAVDDMRDDLAHALSSVQAGGGIQGVSAKTEKNEADDSLVVGVQAETLENTVVKAAIMYKIKRDEEGAVLVRTKGEPGTANPAGTPETIASGVQQLRFNYLDGDGNWQPSWEQAVMPQAVRVGLVLANQDNPKQQVTYSAVLPINVN